MDDDTIVMEPVPLGARFIDGRVEVIEEEIDNDHSIPRYLRTARILKDVRNSICQFIKVTLIDQIMKTVIYLCWM